MYSAVAARPYPSDFSQGPVQWGYSHCALPDKDSGTACMTTHSKDALLLNSLTPVSLPGSPSGATACVVEHASPSQGWREGFSGTTWTWVMDFACPDTIKEMDRATLNA